jgi:crotonobetainyl-CoA:carnitine CoA-transferase CaiB-like acyl-CoA transferase
MGAFGASGPWRGFRAYGSTVEQASGLPFVNGEPDDPPTMQHVAYGDPVAGLYGAVASLIALCGRRRSRAGMLIDLAQVECLFQLCADALVAQSMQEAPLAREGSRHPASAVRTVVSDADARWIAVSVETVVQWNALATAIGHADLRAAATDVSSLKLRESAMEAALCGWAAAQRAKDIIATLRQAGVACGPVHATQDLLADPQLVSFWRRAERRFIGTHVVPHAPYCLDGQRPPLRATAPALGEHNDDVLGGDLGLTRSDLDGLAAAGIIGTRVRVEETATPPLREIAAMKADTAR